MAKDESPDVVDTSLSRRREVEEKLRRAIVRGEFEPGAHLSDRALCDAFKASRAVVREAVRHLEAEGLVESFPNRGSFVKVLSVEAAAQIFDARCVLEAWATRKFLRYASDAKIDEMLSTLEESRRAVLAGERLELIDKKQTYYDLIFSVYENTYIRAMLNQIQNWSGQLRAASLAAPSRVPHAVAELDRLVDAIKRRDEEGAWKASFERVRSVALAALSVMTERSAAQSGADSLAKLEDQPLVGPSGDIGMTGVARTLAAASGRALELANVIGEAPSDIVADPGDIGRGEGVNGKTRSLVNLAMVAALNRPEEVERHVRAGRDQGVTMDEMMEVLLQAAAYCGGAAAVDSFRIGRKVYADSPQ